MEDDALAGALGLEVCYWSRGGACGCKCLIRGACGATCWAEELYVVGEELGRAVG